MEQFRHWSYERQLLGGRGGSLKKILATIIGVYSSHPSAPLSLHARARTFSARSFQKLEADGAALRVPAMRESVYMLPADTAAVTVRATIPPPEDPYWDKRYSNKFRGVPPAKYAGWKKQILKCTGKPVTAAAVKDGVDIPEKVVKSVLNRMAFEGVLLRLGAEGLRSNIIRYVATKKWAKAHVPFAGKPDSIEMALEWLAGEYLRAFGPARVKDFQWWAGTTVGKAKKAFAAHGTVDVGDGARLLSKDLKKYESLRAPKKGSLDVLPQWDSYTMGFAPDGRARLVDPKMQDRVYRSIGATGGNAIGVVLVDGLAHGAWSQKVQGHRLTISLDMFEKASPRLRKDIETRFQTIGKVLEAKELILT